MTDGSVKTNPESGDPSIVRPVGEIDPTVFVLTFNTAKIVLVSYGLHATTVGGVTEYSADYPFHLTTALRQELGQEWNVVFLNAVSGNIKDINHMVNDPDQRKSYEHSRRIGQRLAAAVVKAQQNARGFSVDRLVARSRKVRCALRTVPPAVVRQAEKQVEGAREATFNELHSSAAYILSRTKDRFHVAEIIAFRIGSLGLVGLPGEAFVEIGRQINKDSPFRPTLVIGLVGGAMGYMPHPKGYEEGGYEAGYRSARYDPATPTEWINTASGLLQSLSQ